MNDALLKIGSAKVADEIFFWISDSRGRTWERKMFCPLVISWHRLILSVSGSSMSPPSSLWVITSWSRCSTISEASPVQSALQPIVRILKLIWSYYFARGGQNETKIYCTQYLENHLLPFDIFWIWRRFWVNLATRNFSADTTFILEVETWTGILH